MNMNLCVCIGLIILGFLIFYLSNNSIVEGLKNNNINPQGKATFVNDNSINLENELLIKKYRTNYEDILVDLHKQVGLKILDEIMTNIDTISTNPTSTSSLKYISQINELEKFKSTINETMDVLDNN